MDECELVRVSDNFKSIRKTLGNSGRIEIELGRKTPFIVIDWPNKSSPIFMYSYDPDVFFDPIAVFSHCDPVKAARKGW